jgi:hypothetical protein
MNTWLFLGLMGGIAILAQWASRSKKWRTWSPFQSQQVRQICEHLTEQELAVLMQRGSRYGLWVAGTAAIPIGLAVGFPGSITFVIAGVLIAIHIARIPSWLRSQREFLCSTQWAKEHGYDSHALRLFGLGKSTT